ncbi:MAG: DnaJ family domain-containing protein, partial [Acidimicrobiia bacterium]
MASSHDPVEDQIRRAIERGEFDALPGSGRRLELGENGPAWWAKRKVEEIRRQERAIEMGRRIADLEAKIWTLADE